MKATVHIVKMLDEWLKKHAVKLDRTAFEELTALILEIYQSVLQVAAQQMKEHTDQIYSEVKGGDDESV
jgi:dsDNA-binding SOS-regulon protein